MPAPQIGQAIEEVNSNNQELLRKYRRELQLRKKCHNELVRLKGECLQLCQSCTRCCCRHRGTEKSGNLLKDTPSVWSTPDLNLIIFQAPCPW